MSRLYKPTLFSKSESGSNLLLSIIESPFIEEIVVNRRGKVRRAKLYYLRALTGKKARIKERRV